VVFYLIKLNVRLIL